MGFWKFLFTRWYFYLIFIIFSIINWNSYLSPAEFFGVVTGNFIFAALVGGIFYVIPIIIKKIKRRRKK